MVLSVIGWQARVGFQNLIKSQENQARIGREARLHAAELEEQALTRKTERDKVVLLGALRAEVAHLLGEVHNAENYVSGLIRIERAIMEQHQPPATKVIKFHSFEAPVFRANIASLGLLGANLGADIIKVMSRANGKETQISQEQPIPHEIVLMMYEGNHSMLQKWASDLHHVAMRILSYENRTADPGTLLETESKRYAAIKAMVRTEP
jgi:hypothetical protein